MTRLLRRYVPILGWLPPYDRGGLKGDAVAALSVWALLIPQSLAYSALAGVPARYGLSTAFVALIAYACFGTSRQLAQGPSAAVCAVSAAAITPIVGAAALGSSKAVRFRTRLRELVGEATEATVIVDAEAIQRSDTDGADILTQMAEELRARGNRLRLAGVHPPVLALWRRAGLLDAVGESVFATVDEAVRAANGPPAPDRGAIAVAAAGTREA